uniref:Uncharacterized protein n=1 Tax=Ditylum brightwellii TaxID=49249 RepID=A0A6U3WYY4_9STRA|mmetsp:Transcript_38871/g.58387  ORF Transcript_38871/g.58387 Transcript_38871/m.58387 type:complete len:315 (+) Transcript_38871:399-1343(+)
MTGSLVNLLVGSGSRDLAALILQYLRWADIQRLSVCCQDLNKDLSSSGQHAAIVRWLKELEVLRCLDCPLPIQNKILKSIQDHPSESYRAMACYCNSAMGTNEPYESHGTLQAAFQSMLMSRLFIDGDEIPFQSIQETDLQTMLSGFDCSDGEIIVEGAYINIIDQHQNQEKPTKKKPRTDHQCCSIFCQSSNISRFYFVRSKTYCGKCLDDLFLLKLRFCVEHVRRSYNTSRDGVYKPFSVEEDSYDETWRKDHCELGENEFWVRLFYERNPYDFGEIRFVGLGSRDVSEETPYDVVRGRANRRVDDGDGLFD